ncbi:protein of unknown function [Acidithiobacillus ferrivorans]|uniref:Uncharacterized protein n=1 Tax=Acidithiobacillus ferrivorans TaxID=160808 RepID=A0A060UVU6_9PROT|nr:hypothetical protein AFERRI_10264 [Acidithiobacillus ferrivorans]SMH65015.1 protein of unknown function [Acidithiobacillus ferrivorans]
MEPSPSATVSFLMGSVRYYQHPHALFSTNRNTLQLLFLFTIHYTLDPSRWFTLNEPLFPSVKLDLISM